MPTSLDQDDLRKAAYLIKHSPVPLSHARLIKLLYLCELSSLQTTGRRFTSFAFVHYQHGPYIFGLQDSLMEAGFEIGRDCFDLGSVEVREGVLGPDTRRVLDVILEKFGEMPFGDKKRTGLLHFVYNTLPFAATPYRSTIQFESFLGSPGLDEVLLKKRDYKRVVARAEKTRDLRSQAFTPEGIRRLMEYAGT